MAAFRAGTMLILIGIGVSDDIIYMKTSCLNVQCFLLFLLLDFNDGVEKVLSKSIDVVHLVIKNK